MTGLDGHGGFTGEGYRNAVYDSQIATQSGVPPTVPVYKHFFFTRVLYVR